MKNRKILDRISETVSGEQIVNPIGSEEKYLIEMLKKAVNLVYNEERPLFQYDDQERKGLEQAFVFRAGLYLYELLKNTEYSRLDLDCEYNKELGVKKTRRSGKGIRPDLLLHERNIHDNNIMAVEFKGWWENDLNEDIEKLEDLTSPKGRYKYFIGILVLLEKAGQYFRFFKNGKEVHFE